MSVDEPKDDHEIAQAWNFLKLEAKRVSDSHAKLRARLTPILRQSTNNSEAEYVQGPTTPDPSPFLVEVAGVVAGLRILADDIADTCDKIQF